MAEESSVPAEEAAADEEPVADVVEAESVEAEEEVSLPQRPVRDWSSAPLDFVSAAGWGDEDWLTAVRGFNQALEKYQSGLRAGGLERGTLERIARVADQAGERFAAMADEAPGNVDVTYAVAMAKKLSAAVADVIASAEAAKAEAERARLAKLAAEAAAQDATGAELLATAAKEGAGAQVDPSLWKAEHDQAAARFNEALQLYKRFLADKKAGQALLPQIEELAFAAAKGFEAVRETSKGTAPKIDDSISQCYRLVSDCRRQTLDGAGH